MASTGGKLRPPRPLGSPGLNSNLCSSGIIIILRRKLSGHGTPYSQCLPEEAQGPWDLDPIYSAVVSMSPFSNHCRSVTVPRMSFFLACLGAFAHPGPLCLELTDILIFKIQLACHPQREAFPPSLACSNAILCVLLQDLLISIF